MYKIANRLREEAGAFCLLRGHQRYLTPER